MPLVGPAMLLLGIAITIWLLRREAKRHKREALLHKAHRLEQAKRDADYLRIRAQVRENHELVYTRRKLKQATVATPRNPVSTAPQRVGAVQTTTLVSDRPVVDEQQISSGD